MNYLLLGLIIGCVLGFFVGGFIGMLSIVLCVASAIEPVCPSTSETDPVLSSEESIMHPEQL